MTYEVQVTLVYNIEKYIEVEANSEEEAHLKAAAEGRKISLDQIDTDWKPPTPNHVLVDKIEEI